MYVQEIFQQCNRTVSVWLLEGFTFRLASQLMSVFGLDQDYTEDELRHCVTKWPLWSMVRENYTRGEM